jgi:hypothetical protein
MADFGFNTDLTVKPTQTGSSIGDIVNMARGVQAYQKQAATMPYEIQQQKTASEKGVFDLNQKQTQALYDLAGAALDDPRLKSGKPEDAMDVMLEQKERARALKLPEKTVESIFAPYTYAAIHKTNLLPQMLANTIKGGIGASGQQALQTPQYTTNAAGQIVGLQAGSNQISAPNEAGMQSQVAPQTNATNQMQGQFMQRQSLNPGAAQAGMTNVAAQNLSADFTATQQAASGAEPRIALFQNIKKLAPESFTGVGGARKELATGILNAAGIPAYESEKMSTDELAKSSAMLSLAGGNTDMARQLAEAANPNKKMNEQAIKQIADQMIGMEKLNQAKYKLLAPVANNPQEYANRLSQFNKINDFHIFQESTAEEVAKLKKSMSPEQQRAMGEKIKLARQLGLI